MPHKQKENHDHASFSKKEKKARAAEKAAKKKAALDLQAEEEAQALKLGNNVPLVEGAGEYEVGCEPEREYRFNARKRNKKHLKEDLRKKELAEEERERSAQREAARLASRGGSSSSCSSSSEEEVTVELLVYVCEACCKKFMTRNAFINHCGSNRHRGNARPYEELGECFIAVELAEE
ncbi:hypothetical protein TeGR_g3335, partial [Tetraparma gracilis]